MSDEKIEFGESNPVDTLYLIEEQNKLREKFKVLTAPSAPRTITREQKLSKIAELQSLLYDFKINHDLIIKNGKLDIPYIVNQSGEKSIELVEQAIINLQTFEPIGNPPRRVKTPNPTPVVPANVAGDLENTEQQQQQTLRMRKLDLKIQNLIFGIDEINKDLSLYTMWTKEYVDMRNRQLCDQWNAISLLEEEIVINMTDQSFPYDNSNCRNTLNKMNAVIKTMFSKISAPPQTTVKSSKLPDLKVPIFKGDYKHWPNFKDIFESLIHNRRDLPNIQKMEYLKTYLEGEPLRLISAFTLSSENYDAAFNVLKKRYDNKRKLLTIHLDNMFNSNKQCGTADTIKNLHDSISEGVTAIKNLDVDNTSWGPIIVHFAIKCLDIESRSQFEQKYNDQVDEIPKLEDLLKFLEARYKTLEIIDPLKGNNATHQKTKAHHSNERRSASKEGDQQKCVKCDGEHKLFHCPKFLSLTPKSRFRYVKSVNVCINCLQKHMNKPCESKGVCRVKDCKKPHNSLLHFNKEDSNYQKQATGSQKFFSTIDGNPNQAIVAQQKVTSTENKGLVAMGFETDEILGTASLIVRDLFGNPVTIRALIDTGAQRNFITETLVQKLRLPRLPYRTEVTGIGKVNAHQVKHAVELSIEPKFPSEVCFDIKALVMGTALTSPTPDNTINEKFPDSWPKLQLADKNFRTPDHIDMILGTAIFTKILIPEIHRSNSSGLIAVNSSFGWLILGEVRQTTNALCTSIRSMVAISAVRDEISRFWEVEEIPRTSSLSHDDQLCEDIFDSTHKRTADGRYIVHIPLKEDLLHTSDLQTSRKRALSRFLSQELKFKKDPEYASQYRDFILEYMKLGHMKKASGNLNDGYFMPHHAILKPSSSTTKFRVVFDASSKSAANFSLNSLSLAGPRLQDDLAAIILRWRFYKYVITSDVEKMYRQVLIAPEHQKFQRIFWRNSPELPLEIFELTTVTYGTTSAPYMAVRSLQQLARDDGEKYPTGAKVALKDFYVDDVLTGADTIEECRELQTQLQSLLQGGGFKLRKWMTNAPEILDQVPEENLSKELLNFKDVTGPSLKTLGLMWRPNDDEFVFEVVSIDFDQITPTKRALSSDISKIFDPLGWLSPIIIVAKMLFQETWSLKLDWNELLPSNIISRWKSFRQNLDDINQIRVPRWVSSTSSSCIQLIGFCDASTSAYSAVIYLKTISPSGKASINLLIAKTKVAPIKQQLTVAKLELCGALLLAKLFDYVKNTFNWSKVNFTAFCDSMITLAWIEGNPSRWNIFVANRVSEIQRLTNKDAWKYVSTRDNPADCATRGTTPSQLACHNLWWTGPAWLHLSTDCWPAVEKPSSIDIPDVKSSVKVTVSHATVNQHAAVEQLFNNYSSIHKLKTVVAYCRRFINNCRCRSSQRVSGTISANEAMEAELTIVRQIQIIYYSEEINNLLEGKQIGNKNGILTLAPMLDSTNILRVSGRLENTILTYNEKHPIILPRQSYVSRLLVIEAHQKSNHGLNSLTEYIVRRKYWIVKCKDLVKNVLFHCIKCRRRYPKLLQQKMGQLPLERVSFTNPFYNTGVDFAGPFSLRAWKGRCNKTYKAYICVFVCMSIRALHLELVTELTADAFLAAYKRFSSRRGPCVHIFSDCGTNFVGANNILQKDLQKFQEQWSSQLKPLAVQGVQWHFNPPSMPHAGGIWEGAVKSIKGLLFKHLGSSSLTYEEFLTILVQIEGSLNSRPLGKLTDSTEDQKVITPNHFLNGAGLFTHPEPDTSNISLSHRWKYLQILKQQLLTEFRHQMLHSLQTRKKWVHQQPNVNIKDVVIFEDPSKSPHMWPIGLIVDVHPGRDGLVRVVSLKLESGKILKRPITKICPIPVLEDPHESYNLKTIAKKGVSDEPSTIKPAMLQNKPSHSATRYNLRKRPTTTNTTCLWIGVLLMLCCPSQTLAKPVTIQQFDHNSGVFFAKMGNLKFSSNSWSMIMYYNLTSFFNELSYLEMSAQLFLDKCAVHESVFSFCQASYSDIRIQLDEIIQDNEVLMEMNHFVDQLLQNERPKRSVSSLLPFVGTLSRAAFGTLDEEYAKHMEFTIANMQRDDQHLLELVKNHTSIMETFLQQARLTEHRTQQQYEWMSASLTSMSNEIHNEKMLNLLIVRLQFIAAHIISRTQHLFAIQSAMILAITNAHDGNFRAILHPSVFKKQLNLMKSSLTSEYTTPITTDNLIKLYSLLTVKTRVSNKLIMFQFILPLISRHQYELYKTIPIPISKGGGMLLIQPTSDYLAVNLNRDKYIEMNTVEISECSNLDDETFLCEQHRPEFKNIPERNSCEMKLFMHQEVDVSTCKVISTTSEQLWIQLPTQHQWVFYIQQKETYNVICGKDVSNQKLQGVGILTLDQKCSLEHRTFTLPRSGMIGMQEFEIQLVFPEVNLSMKADFEPLFVVNNKSTVMVKTTDNFKDLERSLNSVKHEQRLITKPFVENLSIGTFSIVITALLCAAGTMAFRWIRRVIPPTPAPRRNIKIEKKDDRVAETESHPLDDLPYS